MKSVKVQISRGYKGTLFVNGGVVWLVSGCQAHMLSRWAEALGRIVHSIKAGENIYVNLTDAAEGVANVRFAARIIEHRFTPKEAVKSFRNVVRAAVKAGMLERRTFYYERLRAWEQILKENGWWDQ